MRIAMIGTGYVGLVTGVCLSDFGHDVACVDRDAAKIAQLRRGETPIYEPGLEALLAKNVRAGRLTFEDHLAPALAGARAVFVAVGTPARRGDGQADLTYVFDAVAEAAPLLEAGAVLVIKSTVPVGTHRRVAALLAELRPGIDAHVVSNPEFLRQGAAIEDFMRPDRVVVGLETDLARETMRAVYAPLSLRETPMLFANPESAELIKYASNAFLATKITFINEIADLCERVGADVQHVAHGMGLDRRIGAKFLHPGPGFGGSCFPKDTLALARSGRELDAPQRLAETVVQVNGERKRRMAGRILEALGPRPAGRRVAVFGATFKPDTDDMREAPSLTIVPALIGAGLSVTICDPHGWREGEQLLPGAAWESDPYRAVEGAAALVVLTEWNMFRGLDLAVLRSRMEGDLLFDLRNIYRSADAREAGFRYAGVGRS